MCLLLPISSEQLFEGTGMFGNGINMEPNFMRKGISAHIRLVILVSCLPVRHYFRNVGCSLIAGTKFINP